MLSIKDLHVSYGGIKALRGIDIEVPDDNTWIDIYSKQEIEDEFNENI